LVGLPQLVAKSPEFFTPPRHLCFSHRWVAWQTTFYRKGLNYGS
jgi:hypothetical protein